MYIRGFVSDRDILEHIIYDFSDMEMMEAVGVCVPEWELLMCSDVVVSSFLQSV